EGFLAKGLELRRRPEAEGYDIVQCVDGRVFERYSVPQRVGGVTVGRVWSFRDLTQRRELEEQLRQSQRMDAIGQLAGGIAHDFNNLLTVIRAHADFLLEAIAPDAPHRPDVEAIIEAARRSAGLTRQLLAFSRKQLLQPVVFELHTVVSRLEPMLRRIIGEDIAITTRAKGGPTVVSADVGQMEQVVVNLVINARDAMPRGGRLSVETALVVFGESDERPGRGVMPAGEFVLLTVSDTGIGISPDKIDRVFEPFFTTKGVGKGTGLGLSTVYGIVKQSGGYIWLESEVGVGTTLSIYLPRASGEAVALQESPHVRQHVGGSETILVAEDEPEVAAVTCRTLRRAGYRVLAAANGREALAVAAHYQGPIDLLLSDVIMPEMGGRDLSEQLRAARPDVRVLYMSGYTHNEIDGRGLVQKDAAFLHKPFEVRELTDAVRAALGHAPRASASSSPPRAGGFAMRSQEGAPTE
ncbi:MAG TPA: ATP-binding protein, partial [Gemmatimonadales bacterium]|nr:ATP-binding protein [Gemmatimonadales bacterium]